MNTPQRRGVGARGVVQRNVYVAIDVIVERGGAMAVPPGTSPGPSSRGRLRRPVGGEVRGGDKSTPGFIMMLRYVSGCGVDSGSRR